MKFHVATFLFVFQTLITLGQASHHARPHHPNDSTLTERVVMPNSTATIILPNDFESFEGLNGFVQPKLGVAFVAIEHEGISFSEFRKGWTDEFLAKNELTLLSKSTVSVDGRLADLYLLSFPTNNQVWLRLMLVTGTDTSNAMYMFNYLEHLNTSVYENYKNSLLSISFNE